MSSACFSGFLVIHKYNEPSIISNCKATMWQERAEIRKMKVKNFCQTEKFAPLKEENFKNIYCIIHQAVGCPTVF